MNEQQGTVVRPKEQLMQSIDVWLRKVDTPEWKQFRAKKLGWTLAADWERNAGLVERPENEMQLPKLRTPIVLLLPDPILRGVPTRNGTPQTHSSSRDFRGSRC